jgi:hypothetical protein
LTTDLTPLEPGRRIDDACAAAAKKYAEVERIASAKIVHQCTRTDLCADVDIVSRIRRPPPAKPGE